MKATYAQLITKIDELTNKAIQISFEINRLFAINEKETSSLTSQTTSIPPAVSLTTRSSITLSMDADSPVNITVPSFLNIQKYNG